MYLKKKLSRGQVPKQTCSQSAVRGVSTHDAKEENVCGTKEGLHRVYTGRDSCPVVVRAVAVKEFPLQ